MTKKERSEGNSLAQRVRSAHRRSDRPTGRRASRPPDSSAGRLPSTATTGRGGRGNDEAGEARRSLRGPAVGRRRGEHREGRGGQLRWPSRASGAIEPCPWSVEGTEARREASLRPERTFSRSRFGKAEGGLSRVWETDELRPRAGVGAGGLSCGYPVGRPTG